MKSVTHPATAGVDVDRAMSFADAALGAAGREVTDPIVRDLARQVAPGGIAIDDAAARAKKYLLGAR